jgi:ABC-type sugar transport system ATPase subunit
MSFGTLTAILQLAGQVQSPFAGLSGLLPRTYGVIASAERLMEIESLPGEIEINKKEINMSDVYGHLQYIQFEKVSFEYDRDRVFQNAGLTIDKGDFVVVSGPSGIGKSTLFKLLLGVLAPAAGSIYFVQDTGEKISANKHTRKLFAYVPQGNLLLSGSIRDSIAFAQAKASDMEIMAAAEVSCAAEFIRALPNGLDTVIGGVYPRDRYNVLPLPGQFYTERPSCFWMRPPPLLTSPPKKDCLRISKEWRIRPAFSSLTKKRRCPYATKKSVYRTERLKPSKGGFKLQPIPPERNYLIRLPSSVMEAAQPPVPPEEMEPEKLYRLSARHSVSNMAWYGLKKLEHDHQLPKVMMEKFRSDYNKAAGKEAMQHIMLEKVLAAFEENHIACMPLKGCLLKHLYTHPNMRLMADIDILFETEQAELVKSLMTDLGFTVDHVGGNHDCYGLLPYMKIEMHHRLVPEDSPYSAYLEKTWDRTKLKENCRYTYELSHEDFFIYLVVHLTKHYMGGGTGIRSFMDIWVYKKRYQNEMDWDYIEAELTEINLREFAENILGLCEVWFDNMESSALYEEMAEYVLDSGVYGTRKHAVVSSMGIKSSKRHSVKMVKWLYGLKLFFPPLDIMKVQYPLLEAVPFLLPVSWGLRGIRCIVFKSRHTLQMINNVHSVSEQDMRKI